MYADSKLEKMAQIKSLSLTFLLQIGIGWLGIASSLASTHGQVIHRKNHPLLSSAFHPIRDCIVVNSQGLA